MKWASAISTRESIEACIDETSANAKKVLGDAPPHLTIIFVSPHYRQQYKDIPRLIRDRMDPGMLFGCSGGGIIGGGQEVEQNSAFSMTVAHLPDVEIKPIYSDTLQLPDQDTGPSVWREWLGLDAQLRPNFIFLADPFSFRAEDFLAGVDFAYPNSGKVGGLASGAQSGGGNVLYLGDKIYGNGLIGLGLTGNVRMDTIVAQGCRPIGKPMTITKCKDSMLERLEGTPPMEVLQQLHETLSESDQKLMQTSLFLGIEMDPLIDEPKQGDFLIRNLMGVDRESGGLAIGSLLREGQLVQFHLRDKALSAEDLNLMLTRYRSEKQPENASGGLLFSCLGRGQYLYGKPNHDSEMFQDKLGEIPLGGFFCNGEIGPVGGTTFLHGYTSSFGIFSPEK